MRAEITVSGVVQGVGFRPFIYRTAQNFSLKGFIRNRGDAGVEIVVEGEKEFIAKFIEAIEKDPPPLARIEKLTALYGEKEIGFSSFSIYGSFENRTISGSIVPPDVSICNHCLKEMRDPSNYRYNYFFITCTDCGPRYTAIKNLPYDRPNTTMDEFPLCDTCSKEYLDPSDRRFHAQTIACQKCGPRVILTTNKGEPANIDNPIREAGKLLEEGYVLGMKGNGGFHLATSTLKSEPITRLRGVKHRAQKPLAIMARSLEDTRRFAKVSLKEAELLESNIKPIVLLEKNSNYYLSEQISPGLHNVGVMLPYTGLHHILFDRVKEPAFIMTSANPPSEPIIVENEEAIRRLGDVADYFLLHNRKIAQRCDDSVLRVNGDKPCIIRRSRGYTPSPVSIKSSARICGLGLGAEENVTGCILHRDKGFMTQYIGDVEKVETMNFHVSAVEHMIHLTNVKIEVVACDLHPKFATTKLAHQLAEKFGCEAVQIQHHAAHLASLVGEIGIENAIGIVCDGYGYGLDGQAWGGEILGISKDGLRREGHLQMQPMAGGDKAAYFPLRMAAGILNSALEIENWLKGKTNLFPYGEEEVNIILNQLKKGKTTYTSSCGRVLDAVSALLGICYERTYEGEPAVKLEGYASAGKDALRLKPLIENSTLNTTYLLVQILENLGKFSVSDLACSAQAYLSRGLAELAVEAAQKEEINTVGFTGGVAYNHYITGTIRKFIEKSNLKFIVPEQVPPGDGGISFGQAFLACAPGFQNTFIGDKLFSI